MILQDLLLTDLPKLIVTDMYLLGMARTEFLSDLKNMDKYKHIHIIVLPSVKSSGRLGIIELGADEYLIKPSTYEESIQVAMAIAEKVAKS